MKLRIEFSSLEYRDVTWNGEIMDFPHLINFNSRNYEWVVYDKDSTGRFDYILHFSKLSSTDFDFNKVAPKWEDLFGLGGDTCECGARFSSFSWDHMHFCKLWRKW